MTGGIRAFSVHLPLTPPLLYYVTIILLLWPSTAIWLFVYIQVNTGVLAVVLD